MVWSKLIIGLAALAAFAASLPLSYAATPVPGMGFFEARREVTTLLGRMYRGAFNESWRPIEGFTTYPVRNIKVGSRGIAFETGRHVMTSKFWGTMEDIADQLVFLYRDVEPIKVSEKHPHEPPLAWYAGPSDTEFACARKCGNFFWTDRADADRFAIALNALIAHSRMDIRNDFDRFRIRAAHWRALAAKPPLSQEANRLRLLAEAAIQRNDLEVAADRYSEALIGFYGWPEGWLNLALVCEALKDFQCASDSIRRYLELSPDSPEATAARESLLSWEILSRQ